jgi:hypothetical protein
MARVSWALVPSRYWMNAHAAAWCVLLALMARSSPPREDCGVALGNGIQPVFPATAG